MTDLEGETYDIARRSRVNKCAREGRVVRNLERGRGRMRTKNNCREVGQSGGELGERLRENENKEQL